MANTIHVIAPFHSRLVKELWSHCAFTQITLKQIKIFKNLGFRVIDYSNFGSESVADEHVEILNKKSFDEHFSDDGAPGHKSEIGSKGWAAWYGRLLMEIMPRLAEPGKHIIVHTFADSASSLTKIAPDKIHVESHVGYDRPPFNAYRAYVSHTWRAFHWGKHGSTNKDHRYSYVVHPYYDVDDWPFRPRPEKYVAFMGRVTPDKGIATIADIARRMPDLDFKIAGSGSFEGYDPPPNVEYKGVLPGSSRAKFMGNASVLLCPTEYNEPCAGVAMESMMCGTPVVASRWGGFPEVITPGVTGYTAGMLKQWISGIKDAFKIDRKKCSEKARLDFGLAAAGKQYGEMFEELLALHVDGWFNGTTIAVPQSPIKVKPVVITPARSFADSRRMTKSRTQAKSSTNRKRRQART